MTLPRAHDDREYQNFVDRNNLSTRLVALNLLPGETIPTEESSLISKILNAEDRVRQFTFLDGGSKNERVSEILISAASVGIQVIKKDYTYIQVGNNYVLESETTSIV